MIIRFWTTIDAMMTKCMIEKNKKPKKEKTNKQISLILLNQRISKENWLFDGNLKRVFSEIEGDYNIYWFNFINYGEEFSYESLYLFK